MPEEETGQAAEHEDLGDALRRWDSSTQPFPVEEARWGELVGLLGTDLGLDVVLCLRKSPHVAEALLPDIIEAFRESLRVRRVGVRMDDRDHPVARLRHMCVLLFQTLGEKAAAVGPDLMALQRRVMVEMECPLPRDSLGTAIARVCSVTPELVVDAANSLEPAMRREACRIMRRMDGDRAAMEPTLVVRVADPDIEVVAQAMAALLKFGWVTESALTRARRRILDAEDSNWRVEGMLARMEAIVAEEDDSE